VWPAHWTLAQEAIGRADTAAALEHFLAVTHGNPRLTWAWIRTGDLLFALGRNDPARDAYERARRLEPANVAALLGIGWTQMRGRRFDLASSTWAPLTGATRDPATLRAMAEVFERAGNDAALAEARQALAALPPESRP
jgi:tetratricopeptide (TPR) repeat protein